MSLAQIEYRGVTIELSMSPITGHPVYTIYRKGKRISCSNATQESRYPKVASWIGTGLVKGYQAAQHKEATR